MKRTTIFADENLIRELKEISQEENKSMAETVREAIENYILQKKGKKKKLSFVGIGDSGRKNISEIHEELLWKKVTK